MSRIRSAGIINMDGGLWFDKPEDGDGIGVTDAVAAARYENLGTFQNLLSNEVKWSPNRWDGEDKKLVDSKYGYKIVDTIWTEEKRQEDPWDKSALAADSVNGDNIIARLSVLRSLDNDRYLWVNPDTVSFPADQVQFAWVSSHNQATRFANLAPVVGWLNNSVLGDSSAGFEIEQYFFTKPVDAERDFEYFSGEPTGDRAIERAYIPFSKEKGTYLWIEDETLPPKEMTFDFTTNQYAAVRFQNIGDFLTILNQTYLANEAYGWSLPQFYFNRAATPIEQNPFQVFWCIENNGPFNVISDRVTVCEWINGLANKYSEDFSQFLGQVSKSLLESSYYPDPKGFDNWWRQQDYYAFEQWMYQIWEQAEGDGEGGEFGVVGF